LPNRYGHPSGTRPQRAARHAAFPLLVAALGVLAGCAAPGQPRPPREQEPETVADLQAHQAGTAVILHFTLPLRSTDGDMLQGPARVELYRQFSAAGAPPPAGAAAAAGVPLRTLEPTQLAPFLSDNTVTFPDTLTPQEFQAHRGEEVIYRVRAAAGESAWSEPSNEARVALVAPPGPVRDVAATVAQDGITLRWAPPAPATGPAPTNYIVYRATIPAGGAAAAPAPVGVAADSFFRDPDVQPGHDYRYTVRSVAPAPSGQVESADSVPVEVHVEGAASPAPPAGLEAVPVRLEAGSLEVDLSWAIAGEQNLAGYNIYRSEQPGARGERLNRRLVAAAAFRDTTVAPGRTYRYTVTAVDLAGNESVPSAPAAVTIPAADSAPH
jgi:hypothetical protein